MVNASRQEPSLAIAVTCNLPPSVEACHIYSDGHRDVRSHVLLTSRQRWRHPWECQDTPGRTSSSQQLPAQGKTRKLFKGTQPVTACLLKVRKMRKCTSDVICGPPSTPILRAALPARYSSGCRSPLVHWLLRYTFTPCMPAQFSLSTFLAGDRL